MNKHAMGEVHFGAINDGRVIHLSLTRGPVNERVAVAIEGSPHERVILFVTQPINKDNLNVANGRPTILGSPLLVQKPEHSKHQIHINVDVKRFVRIHVIKAMNSQNCAIRNYIYNSRNVCVVAEGRGVRLGNVDVKLLDAI